MSLLLFACKDQQGLSSDKIIVGTSADNPPYEFLKDNEIIGFDIDFINLIAKEMKVEIEIKNMEFSSLIPALTNGHIDMVVAGLSMNEKRKKMIDFSDNYAKSIVAIMSLKDSEINKTEDLEGKVIGVQLGTTWEAIAASLAQQFPNITVLPLNNNLILFEELKNKRVDAVIMEDLQIQKFLSKNDNLNSFELSESRSEFSVALRKDSDLTEKVNEAIKTLKARGKISKLKTKWMK